MGLARRCINEAVNEEKRITVDLGAAANASWCGNASSESLRNAFSPWVSLQQPGISNNPPSGKRHSGRCHFALIPDRALGRLYEKLLMKPTL